MGVSHLHRAKRNKNDEFYTQKKDIENELQHYIKHFKNKVVYCNCDDPYHSQFFQYFYDNFNNLKLKNLLTCCKGNVKNEFFKDNPSNNSLSYNYNLGKIKILKDGDFRSQESIKLLKQADIVVTNPPFSLFREYVKQLMEYKKKFLVIGNLNVVSYKDIFPYIKDNKIWLGASIHSGDREFGVPSSYPLEATSFRVDDSGNKFIRVKGVRWFTNLKHNIRNEKLYLTEKYNPKKYPKYDNFDAINIDKTKEIPKDYKGIMGVPISFLDKHNPNQFEIVGSCRHIPQELYKKIIKPNWSKGYNDPYLNNKQKYVRIFIRNKTL